MRLLILCILMHACMPAFALCEFPVPAYQISELAFTGISRAQYDRVNELIYKLYAPVFAKRGCPLVVEDEWKNSQVNAQAWQKNGHCHIAIFGGLARYALMNENAVLQIGFHEIGHHLGGAPYYTGSSMSVEGQSDCWATAVGMKKARRGSAHSSLRVTRMLAELNDDPWPSRPVPPLPPVSRTMQGHPPAPCRLLTYDNCALGYERPRCWFKP